MTRKLFKNGFVVSMDPTIGDIPNADVLVENDKILEIAPNIEAEGAEVIDAKGCIVMPGLIDTHRHVWQGPLRGIAGDWSLNDYFRAIRMNAANLYRPEDMYAAHYHGALEALDAGVTTVADYCHNVIGPDHAYEAINGLRDSGARVIWSYGFSRPPIKDRPFKKLQDQLDFARKVASEQFTSKDSLVTMSVSPEESMWWKDDDQRGIKQFNLARELDLPIYWHCNVSTSRDDGTRQRDVARLKDLGLLDSDIVMVHTNLNDYDEWVMMADAGVGVSFTPDTELQMGLQWSPTELARSFGVKQSYGADTSNNSGDMFLTLHMALQVARCIMHERMYGDQMSQGVAIEAKEALGWGTIEAAEAIGMDDRIGSLKPGKQADIVMMRMDGLPMIGWDRTNPAATLMLHGHSRFVDTVMVGGNVVKAGGQMIQDTTRACTLLENTYERITRLVNERGGYLVPWEEAMRLVHLIRDEF